MIFKCYQDDIDEAEDFESNWSYDDLRMVAKEYAKYYYNNRDGWEWGNDGFEVHIMDYDGIWQAFNVSVDFEPIFYCSPKDDD